MFRHFTCLRGCLQLGNWNQTANTNARGLRFNLNRHAFPPTAPKSTTSTRFVR